MIIEVLVLKFMKKNFILKNSYNNLVINVSIEISGYAWASSSRRTDEMKKIWIPDTVVTLTGRFVLVYVSAKNSIMGMSDPFDVM